MGESSDGGVMVEEWRKRKMYGGFGGRGWIGMKGKGWSTDERAGEREGMGKRGVRI